MEKAGLIKEGFLAKHVFMHGKYEDVLLYGLVLSGRGGE
jgi:RimJ/RimL family protein N-acetyltransferase